MNFKCMPPERPDYMPNGPVALKLSKSPHPTK